MTDYVNADWSEQDANNTSPQPNGVQGGYSPSSIAPILRAIRGAAKREFVRTNPIFTSTGTGAAYVLTFVQAPTAYYKGMVLRFWSHINNTGACTLNVNSLGAKSILSTHGTALTAGQIRANKVVELVYDGTSFTLLSADVQDPKFTGNLSVNGSISANTASISGALTANSGTFSALTSNTANITTFTAPTTVTDSVVVRPTAANTGYSNLRSGTTERSGLLEFRNGDGVRAGYLGFANSGIIYMTGENGHVWNANALTIAGNTAWHAGNDGASSGLDADLLDGQHGTYYRDLANSTGTLPNARLSGAYSGITLSSTDVEITGSTWSAITPFTAGFKISGNAPNIQFRDTTTGSLGAIVGVNVDTFTIYNSSNTGLLDTTILSMSLTGTGDMTFNGHKVWTAGNDGSASGLDSDLLDGQHGTYYRDLTNSTGTLPNARISGAYDGITTLGMSGVFSITNAAPEIKLIDTTASSYSGRIRVNSNNFSFDSSTDDVTFGEVFRFELDTKVGYANGSRIWTDAYATTSRINTIIGYTPVTPARLVTAGNGLTGGGSLGADRTLTLGTPGSISGSSTNSVTTTSHTHELLLASADISNALGFTPADRARLITAGNGLTGGGALTADRTVTLGTPGTLTGSTTNAVTTTSHTHAISLSPADVGAPPTSRSINANLGLLGGGDLSADRNISLGTPSNITNSTTNSVTGSTHTHALGFIAAEVFTGSSATTTAFPLGHIVYYYNTNTAVAINGLADPALRTGSTTSYISASNGSAGTALTGTWRSRGAQNDGVDDWMIAQRVA